MSKDKENQHNSLMEELESTRARLTDALYHLAVKNEQGEEIVEMLHEAESNFEKVEDKFENDADVKEVKKLLIL